MLMSSGPQRQDSAGHVVTLAICISTQASSIITMLSMLPKSAAFGSLRHDGSFDQADWSALAALKNHPTDLNVIIRPPDPSESRF